MTLTAHQPKPITRQEFEQISELLRRRTGIRLTPGKESLVMGRLDKRLRQLGIPSYREYLELLNRPEEPELNQAIDLLTTNETFFFREPRHFDYLREVVLPAHPVNRPFRLWSAASSSGEEAYTAAMVLAEALPNTPWEVVGTDVSARVVASAQRGLYPIAAAERIPLPLLRKYCRKGREEYEGLMAIAPDIRARVTFVRANLMDNLHGLGRFDVIFLRNVMIYFGADTKVALLERLEEMLQPGGHLIVSLSETLKGITSRLTMVEPSVYCRGGVGGV
ncbi:CheR family methyltransferase [Cryptosporangium aurantiacum]|uniref:protein-glutamate O-methyltransferase n=1 Tax=Cryptosporangium aurantiacum TaxID=134849 RepID=A0A1M7RGU5_9ACTN|nr:CheR family methyltransferase [Cryptosporangium aurantiacum]SHN45369.1 chemotaxis protein methyltransferase CheR [Cryptosporangium aurantiacum]